MARIVSVLKIAPLVRRTLDDDQAMAIAPTFKALSDPLRLRVLSMIAARSPGGMSVGDLVAESGSSQPTISYHLRHLRDAGLVRGERRGPQVRYRIVTATLDRLSELLDASGRTAS